MDRNQCEKDSLKRLLEGSGIRNVENMKKEVFVMDNSIVAENSEKKAWWSESRFGMFIHWGIYSLKAKGEWVMYQDRIPVKEYEKLAGEFNPVLFDAEEWVLLAKNAGMKYIVITAKHHDGFSMFKTEVSPYNIVDGTPFGRDVMDELALACRKHGLRLCFYYSHVREWRHPHAQSLEASSPSRYGNYGNFWDYPEECKKNLQIYLDEFDKPQLRELLTQYGPIGIIWFDTPSLIRPDQAQEMIDLVRELQPDCLINSRVGDSVDSDYFSLGDCEIPGFGTGVDWETPMTICDAWGYNDKPDNRYRDVRELVHQLVDIASLGGNYLLNVGPDSLGVIPGEAQERLKGLGEWMKTNSESIYASKASPFPIKPSWGRITAKDDRLYLHVYEWNEVIALTGIKSKIAAVKLLADPGRSIKWSQEPCGMLGYDRLVIHLPGDAPDDNASVLMVQFEDKMQVETRIIEDDSGCIEFPACLSSIHSSDECPRMTVNITGIVKNWSSTSDWLSWEFLCAHPGEYDVMVSLSSNFWGLWDFGHKIDIECGENVNHLLIEDTGVPTTGYQQRTYSAGTVSVDSEGQHRISIKATSLSCTNGQGFQLSSVRLQPR
jgi:alpha-L-fucosidase